MHAQRWPQREVAAQGPGTVTIVVQVSGRVRDRIQVPAGASEGEVVTAALAREAVGRHLPDGAPRRVVFVPDRLLNVVP